MSYTNLLYHIVYATKERAPLITNTLSPRVSFEEEFKALLKAHKLDFDEAHLWG